MSPMEHQQFQRLRVNRIAVIQELKVDHILHYLLAKSVLDDYDLNEIEKCRSTTDKSKRLLDILPTKGRASNWYNHFREALLNPSVEDSGIKHKYQILVEFLDNTIIDQMSHPVRLKDRTSGPLTTFTRYQPLPDIANNNSRPPTIVATGTKPSNNLTVNESSYSVGTPRPASASKLVAENSEDIDLIQDKWTMRRLQGKYYWLGLYIV